MILTEKYIRIHKLQDDRWTLKDKLTQYRGILKLHARNKKLNQIEALKLKKKTSRDLKLLVKDVKEHRQVLADILEGDKARLFNSLADHKDLQRAFHDHRPDDVFDVIDQDNKLKSRELFKLAYEKKKRMKRVFDLKLEYSTLSEKSKTEQDYPLDNERQRLITQFMKCMAKMNAGKAIGVAYTSMIEILEKDAIYFDAVITALQKDQREQCKVIIQATLMGQLAAESLDDTRENYKKLSKDVWNNLRDREASLEAVRQQVDDLWAYAQSLIRTEGDHELIIANIGNKGKKHTESSLVNQIKYLEEIMDQVKNAFLVRSYHDLIPRFEEQIRQRKRLLVQFRQNIQKRDLFLNKSKHALLILTSLKQPTPDVNEQFNIDKQALLDEIEIQKKREDEYKKLRKEYGELVMNIKAALQNMVDLMACIRRRGRKKIAPVKQEKKDIVGGEGEEEEEDEGPEIEKVDTDGLVLLSVVSKKIGTLIGMSNIEFEEDKVEKAADLYDTYVADYRSHRKFGITDKNLSGFVVEHEILDLTVPTRTDIKSYSKRVVEANTKLQ